MPGLGLRRLKLSTTLGTNLNNFGTPGLKIGNQGSVSEIYESWHIGQPDLIVAQLIEIFDTTVLRYHTA